ncbi:MAG TPA: hypothetical protein PKD63_07895 [Solirubrobacteraceae bacterium]|nr:hypothetical protein [Solirubrobacteraceae bacterium]
MHTDEFVLLFLLYLGLSLSLIAASSDGGRTVTFLARTVVVLGVGGAVLGVLIALLYFGMRCDEACYSARDADSWQHIKSAWQWWAQLALTIFGLVAMVTADRALARSNTRLAAGSAITAVACFSVWVVLLKPLYD